MKQIDQLLNRLFTAARRAPAAPVGEMSPFLQTRILAGWKSSNPLRDFDRALILAFRHGLIATGFIMLISAGWYFQDAPQDPPEVAFASYELVEAEGQLR